MKLSKHLTIAFLLLATSCAKQPPTTQPTAELATTQPTTRPTGTLKQQLAQILHRLDDTGAIVSARVVDLNRNRVIFADEDTRPMIPASNMKLPVSAAFLATFGKDHTFKTRLAIVPNGSATDVYLIGTGDPAVGDDRIAEWNQTKQFAIFDEFAAALKAAGISQVTGTIYYYDGAFDDVLVHPNWRKDMLVDWYAAPVAGLNLNVNCIDVTLEPAADGTPATYTQLPAAVGPTIINNTISGSSPRPPATQPAEPAIDRLIDAPVFTLTGNITKKVTVESKPITNPGQFFAEAFRAAMTERGIPATGPAVRLTPLRRSMVLAPQEAAPLAVPLPANAQIIATHESRLTDILKRINKNSQNLMAEAAAKLTGQQYLATQGYRGPGSWEAGDTAIRAFLVRSGVDATGFHAQDGSGLGRDNRITAKLMTDLLAAMKRRSDWSTYRDSMAVPGAEGTMGRRLTELEGRVFSKTGFIGGVRSLSGYVHTKSGKWVAFSFIYNQIPGGVRPYEVLQDEAVRLIYNDVK
jgi:D-alanyl-D-alanine carboxypeptidase/D-alanyl-D-alanine-endopeptidase (penicillin-binding protein 4)